MASSPAPGKLVQTGAKTGRTKIHKNFQFMPRAVCSSLIPIYFSFLFPHLLRCSCVQVQSAKTVQLRPSGKSAQSSQPGHGAFDSPEDVIQDPGSKKEKAPRKTAVHGHTKWHTGHKLAASLRDNRLYLFCVVIKVLGALAPLD